MKKLGYTLTEILVALTLVGVIAAITIPQVVNHVEKQKAGALVGRAVEQIELGCQNLIQFYNDKVTDNRLYTTLSEIHNRDDVDVDMALLAKFINATNGTGDYSGPTNEVAYNPLWYIMPAAYAEGLSKDDFTPQYSCPAYKYSVMILFRDDTGALNNIYTCLTQEESDALQENHSDQVPKILVNRKPVVDVPDDYVSTATWMDGVKSNPESSQPETIVPDEPVISGTSTPTAPPESATPDVITPPSYDVQEDVMSEEKTEEKEDINPNLFKIEGLPVEIYFKEELNMNVSKPSDTVATILVDSNGTKKKPNAYGKDTFNFVLLNNGKLRANDDTTAELIRNGFRLKEE